MSSIESLQMRKFWRTMGGRASTFKRSMSMQTHTMPRSNRSGNRRVGAPSISVRVTFRTWTSGSSVAYGISRGRRHCHWAWASPAKVRIHVMQLLHIFARLFLVRTQYVQSVLTSKLSTYIIYQMTFLSCGTLRQARDKIEAFNSGTMEHVLSSSNQQTSGYQILCTLLGTIGPKQTVEEQYFVRVINQLEMIGSFACTDAMYAQHDLLIVKHRIQRQLRNAKDGSRENL